MSNKNLKIYLAAPRGFCAGVDRAIEIVKKSIDKFGAPVYVRHEIVHNKHVVESLKKMERYLLKNWMKSKISLDQLYSQHMGCQNLSQRKLLI